MRRMLATLSVVAAAAGLGAGLEASPAAAMMKGPGIKGVKFVGSPSEPTITIKGVGLGSLPFEDAETVPECFSEEVATGNDFGSALSLQDLTQGWTAGEGSGDCIGLIVSSFTETEVVYHLGSAYSHYPPIAKGDSYTVTVNGLTRSGRVKKMKKK